MSRAITSAIFLCALYSLVIPAPVAAAHETRQVAGVEVTAGWREEPAYAGIKNGISIRVSRSGAGVTGLQLSVEVAFGDAASATKSGPIALVPIPEDAGHYVAPLIPTRAGRYAFRLTGEVADRQVDELFTSGEGTFDDVREPDAVQFPSKDPSAGELAERAQRIATRAERAEESVATLRLVALIGAVAGALGFGLALVAFRKAAKVNDRG